MARKQSRSTTYAAPEGWRMPDEDEPQLDHTAGRIDRAAPYRGRLDSTEEAVIARSHRPIKSTAQQKAEAGARADLRAATRPHPDDLVPLALHTRALTGEGAATGIPDLHPAFLRYLDGATPRVLTEEQRRVAALLGEFAALHPRLYVTVEAYYRYKRTQRDIATEHMLGQATVCRTLKHFNAWLKMRYTELYPAVA